MDHGGSWEGVQIPWILRSCLTFSAIPRIRMSLDTRRVKFASVIMNHEPGRGIGGVVPTSGRAAYNPPATLYATRNRLGLNIGSQLHGKLRELTVDSVDAHDGAAHRYASDSSE